MSAPVLVVGIPRSGTTWVAHVLAVAGDAAYVEEPDNHFRRPYAYRVKRRLGRGEYPLVTADEAPGEYETLWEQALIPDSAQAVPFRSARRRIGERMLASATAAEISAVIAGRARPSTKLDLIERLAIPEFAPGEAEHLVTKSVYAPLAIEWIAGRFAPTVLIVIRHPLNVVSSWLELGWLNRARDDVLDELHPRARQHLAESFGVSAPDRGSSALGRAAWLAASLTCSLLASADRHPDWRAVSHERLCARPQDEFRDLAGRVGLPWPAAAGRELENLNQQGAGYEIRRVARELGAVWRSRLTDEQAREAMEVLECFPDDDRWAF